MRKQLFMANSLRAGINFHPGRLIIGLLTIDYSPFGFVYNNLTRKTCRSIRIGLLKGYDFFQICGRGSPVREYVVSDFSSNEFNGKLPAELGKLPLIVLNISRNEFSGQILTEIGNIRCLKNLDLLVNNLSSIFLVELGKLHDLSNFNISFNPFLAGIILATRKLSTFGKDSFLGNPLLHSSLFNFDDQLPQPPPPPLQSQDKSEFWKALLTGYRCGMVLGVAILYSIFRKGEPHWFATVVDGIHE
ncbi:hypothetical protein Goshw_017418 [Gossypium schwendimanii]|uniref:Uncharacterized protein n=1 Tax=Gossypium schwendimanii TaxID=34291 RepID=A0A7J9M4Z7_GOSSC|nr:hypothetical protein [Gossypium schwendimanii]